MLNDLTKDYEIMFPDKDLHGELIQDLGEPAYEELLSKALSQNKFIFIKRGVDVLDGGKVMLLSSDAELKKLNSTNVNRLLKDVKPGDTIKPLK